MEGLPPEMYPKLWSFLELRKVYDDSYNYTSQLPNYTGKFRIEGKEEEEFWKLYCDYVADPKKYAAGLSQKPSKIGPLRVDIDLKRKVNVKIPEGGTVPKNYKADDLRKVVHAYQCAIKDIAKNRKAAHQVCLVLEKETARYDNGVIRDGFHLHWPCLWMKNTDHDVQLIPRVKRFLDEGFPDMFTDCGYSAPSEALDAKIYDKTWLLYGGCKSSKNLSYKVTKAFDFQGEEVDPYIAFKEFNLLTYELDEIPINNDNWKYHLPRLLSIDPFFLHDHSPSKIKQFEVRSDIVNPVREMISKAEKIVNKTSFINLPDMIREAGELCSMLSSKRIGDYHSWFSLGACLYNISQGCQEGLDLFINVSSRTTKDNYDINDCTSYWSRYEVREKPTMGSLRFWAEADNPDKFAEWRKRKSASSFGNPATWNHNDIARKLKDLIGLNYRFASEEKGGKWFEFTGHRWRLAKNGHAISEKISFLLPMHLNRQFKLLFPESSQGEDSDDEKNESERETKLKELRKVCTKLGNSPFKKAVFAECQEVFRDEEFLERLDTNPWLIGFENGVWDCHKMTFRPGDQEDYISKTTGYDYVEFTENSPEVIDLEDILRKIFPDPELYDFWMDYAACLLRGGNYRKTLLNLHGAGDNGKSVLIELMEHTLGKGKKGYMIKLPTSLITGKRTASSSATPELNRSKGARFAVLQEPDGKDETNFGIIKELTGNDSFFSRGLYSEGGEILPMFKTALTSNQLPKLPPHVDRAGLNRLEVLPFESWFPRKLNDVPPTKEEQLQKKIFPRDNDLSEKLPKYKQAMMWLMIERYKKINGRMSSNRPAKVDMATHKYELDNDIFAEFISERMKHDEKIKCSCNLTDVWTWFCDWYKYARPGMKIVEKKLLNDYLITKWGQPGASLRWKYWRLRKQEDDISEGRILELNEEDLLPSEEVK